MFEDVESESCKSTPPLTNNNTCQEVRRAVGYKIYNNKTAFYFDNN